MEPVRGWQQAEGQLNRFPGQDWRQITLIVRVEGQPQIIERRLAQHAQVDDQQLQPVQEHRSLKT